MTNRLSDAPELSSAESPPSGKGEAVRIAARVHPLAWALAVAFALNAFLRWLFFHFSERIWALRQEVPIESVTPWARWSMKDRDGVEPQVLLLLILILVTVTAAVTKLIDKASAAWRLVAAAVCLIGCGTFLLSVPFAPPVAQISNYGSHIFLVVAGVLLVAAATQWASHRPVAYGLLIFLLIPVCFLTASPESMSPDLSCILAPALLLRLGFPLHAIYFQYDLLPSLIAVGWHWLGADPAMFSFCTRTSYFLFLLGCFFLARRLFEDQRLVALFLVALCVVRVYGLMDEANAFPQVTPLRVDLWIVPLAIALLFGLEHWTVGLATGLVFFFLRSFGMLYVGSYALALIAEFCARRSASSQPLTLLEDLATSLRRVLPSLIMIVIGIAAARLAFGSFVSDAVLIYHRLGPGMMRTAPGSFYWWIAPAIAVTAALAFRCRFLLPEKRAQAALFAVALAIGNSIYFFGRSHENNLMNISASLLLSFFLGVDLAILTLPPGRTRRLFLVLPWGALAMIAFFYSGRIFGKVLDQATAITQVPRAFKSPQPIACAEINALSPDHRVFVFSEYDYWFYERCGYVPQGYIQPLYLQLLRSDVIAQMNGLLDQGYKVVVPKVSTPGYDWAEFVPGLNSTYQLETTNYILYGKWP